MTNEYDELKSLLKKTRILMEQSTINNMAKSIENNIDSDVEKDDIDTDDVKKDKSKDEAYHTWRIPSEGVAP